MARYMAAKPPKAEAMTAIAQELALDAGRRAACVEDAHLAALERVVAAVRAYFREEHDREVTPAENALYIALAALPPEEM